MASYRQRRVRIPVLSRLTVAWLGSLAAVVGLAGFAFMAGRGDPPEKVALKIEALERIAPPIASSQPNTQAQDLPLRGAEGLTLAAAPVLRDGDAPGVITIRPRAEGLDADDFLLYAEDDHGFGGTQIDEDLAFTEDDIVITIAGGARAASPVNASAVLPARPMPIPDPDPRLLQSTPLGKIPRVSADGRKAANYYARPFEGGASAPKVAIIIGGLGLNTRITERAIDELPPEVSLAFAPYAKNLEFWTQKARNAGHEVLIELPMESHSANQAALGAAALLTSRSPEENLQRLDWLLSRFGGYFAATNYMGGKFAADDASLSPVLARLRDAGVGYIDDTGAAKTAGAKSGALWTSVNRMIPPAPDASGASKVRRELTALEKIAARDGAALGKTYAYASTIDEITAWADSLGDRQIAIAPASAVLHDRKNAR